MFKFIILGSVLFFSLSSIGQSYPGNELAENKQINTVYMGGSTADQTGQWTDGLECPSSEQANILYKVQIPWQWYAPHQALWFKINSNCNYTVDLTRFGPHRRPGMFAKINKVLDKCILNMTMDRINDLSQPRRPYHLLFYNCFHFSNEVFKKICAAFS